MITLKSSSGPLLAVFLSLSACDEKRQPGNNPSDLPAPSAVGSAHVPALGTSRTAATAQGPEASSTAAPLDGPDAGSLEKKRPPWDGPFFALTRSSSGIYKTPAIKRANKLGYVEAGGRVPVKEDRVQGTGCREGWYELVDGGYICSAHGTTNLEHPRVKTGRSQPDVEKVLPFKYARNTANGTPLYKSVPSKEQLRRYEPYLFEKKQAETPNGVQKTPQKQSTNASSAPADKKPPTEADIRAIEARRRRDEARRRAQAAQKDSLLSAAVLAKLNQADPGSVEPPVRSAPDAGAAWWRKKNPGLSSVTLKDMRQDSDDVLDRRLAKGFYIAIDRRFNWNNRPWYRTTKGFVAPANRFHLTNGSTFKGVELTDAMQLPVGWAYGFRKARPTYKIDAETNVVAAAGSIKTKTAINLTEERIKIGKQTFVKAVDGFWLRASHLRITAPGPRPEEVGHRERWVDVNLQSQTVVLFEGDTPLFATLISSGKKHKDPEKDHRTPLGQWRVGMKHVTTTMDGDGTAAGDLPYSIEGVPYVMYFHRSYALHGAFWHRNYGVRMSHGCINLSPLDAKYLFFNTAPTVYEGWHGAWSSEESAGSLIVVHE